MDERTSRGILVVNAYRPATFYALLSSLIGLAIILYAFLSRDPTVLVLLVFPLWMYSYSLKRLRPLSDAGIGLHGGGIYVSLEKGYRVDEVSRGRLSIVYTLSEGSEDVSVEYDGTRCDSCYRVENGKLILDKGRGLGFIGVRVKPTSIAVLLEDAYKIRFNGRAVYMGYMSRGSIKLETSIEGASVDVEEDGVVTIGFKELPGNPLELYVYSECCGFKSKPVLVGRFSEEPVEARVKIGVPQEDAIIVMPDKPYLPSLAGHMLSGLGFPSSYTTTHPDSRIVIGVGGRGEISGRIILKPFTTTGSDNELQG